MRKGRISDASAVAQLARAVGGDAIRFILTGICQSLPAMDVHQAMVREPRGIYLIEKCVVAVAGKNVAEMDDAFSAGPLRSEYSILKLPARDLRRKPRFDLNDRTSYLLHNTCVAAVHRRGPNRSICIGGGRPRCKTRRARLVNASCMGGQSRCHRVLSRVRLSSMRPRTNTVASRFGARERKFAHEAAATYYPRLPAFQDEESV